MNLQNDGGETFDRIGDIFERLEMDRRTDPVGTWAMNRDVHNDSDLREARDYINHAKSQKLVTAAELARRTGIKESAISAFCTDKWKGSKGTLYSTATMLAKAVTQLVKQRQADETKIGGFVYTRIARAIWDVVEYAIKRRMIGVFVIPAGCGKTMALDAIHDDKPGSLLVTVTGTRAARKPFLQSLSRALGLSESGRAEDLQDAVIERLRGSDRLVMVDEAHKLQVAALDTIREIWDAGKVPIILAGTPTFLQSLTSRRVGSLHAEILDQLSSRVGISRDLTDLATTTGGDPERLFTTEDIRKVFHRGGVRLTRDGEEFLCRLANTPGAGALRKCADLVQIVVDLYPKEPVTAARLRDALRMKLGTREAGFRLDVIDGAGEPAEVATAVGA